jgi:hypothetical protein
MRRRVRCWRLAPPRAQPQLVLPLQPLLTPTQDAPITQQAPRMRANVAGHTAGLWVNGERPRSGNKLARHPSRRQGGRGAVSKKKRWRVGGFWWCGGQLSGRWPRCQREPTGVVGVWAGGKGGVKCKRGGAALARTAEEESRRGWDCVQRGACLLLNAWEGSSAVARGAPKAATAASRLLILLLPLGLQ